MDVIGKSDKHLIVSGVFKLHDESGIDLVDLFIMLNDEGCMPCFLTFIQDAINSGWYKKTIQRKLNYALIDAYGIEFYNNWLKKIDTMQLDKIIVAK